MGNIQSWDLKFPVKRIHYQLPSLIIIRAAGSSINFIKCNILQLCWISYNGHILNLLYRLSFVYCKVYLWNRRNLNFALTFLPRYSIVLQKLVLKYHFLNVKVYCLYRYIPLPSAMPSWENKKGYSIWTVSSFSDCDLWTISVPCGKIKKEFPLLCKRFIFW